MQIYDVLQNDHNRLKDLLIDLSELQAGDENRAEIILERIYNELAPHSKAEESVFYNSLRSIPGADEIVLHGYEEHMEAESLLSKLRSMHKIDADWKKTAAEFRQALEHHIHEEETRIFDAARQLLSAEEATMMTEAFEELKGDVQRGSVVQDSLDMVAKLMPTRFAASLRTATLRPN